MTKDGFGIFVLVTAFIVVVLALYHFTELKIFLISGYLLLVFLLFVVYFFRDPERIIPEDESTIVSPADGKVVKIEEVFEDTYINEKVYKISIFLSVLDVHINRIPASGTVEKLEYKKGRFFNAMNHKASELNEASVIGIRTENGRILFKQIAGLIARRIVTRLKIGQDVIRGDRFGMIKFGSRVDIFLPLSTELNIKLNDRVKGGETIIGRFK